MNIALNNGLTLQEIDETIIRALPCVGFPAVGTAPLRRPPRSRGRGLSTTTPFTRGIAACKGQAGMSVRQRRTLPSGNANAFALTLIP